MPAAEAPMPSFVAFLRAVNVGGANVVRMADLREAFAAAGFHQVTTFRQSGNVRFEAAGTPAVVQRKAQAAVTKLMKQDTAVMVRTRPQLRALLKADPFGDLRKLGPDEARLYVSFLGKVPDKALPKASPTGDLEFLGRRGKDVFSVGRRVRGHSGNPNAFVEKELGVRATTRYWSVVEAMVELA